MNIFKSLGPCAALLGGLALMPATGAAKAPAAEPFTLKPSLNLRLRHETAEQDNALEDASSSTLRYRLGLAAKPADGLSLYLESEGVSALADEDYNSGPGGNGNATYSIIGDPTGHELNQAYVDWKASDLVALRVGRQRLIYDNARFIGNVGWRQNEQTFDAAQLSLTPEGPLSFKYAYLSNVNRIFFSNADIEGHLLNLSAGLSSALKLTAYAYLLDYTAGTDHQTLGLRATGKLPLGGMKLGYVAEYATQDSYADAPDSVDADYTAVELSLAAKGFSLGLGQELLSGDGTYGFSTPLATGHKFNGWADLFLGTPASGLEDSYVKAGYKTGAWKALAFYHSFAADAGGADYGTELDLLLGYKLCKQASLTLKFADYSADTLGVDTTRFTAQIDFKI